MGSLSHWLESLGLGDYLDRFEAQAIAFDQLAQLDEHDLRELGVDRLGHRKRLLMAIEVLRDDAARRADVTARGRLRGEGFPAELRQITVVFCDLVASTELAAILDPEDMRGLLAAYHAQAARIVADWGGHVAQFLGDGILLLFGYPAAHEEDAERAVRASRDIISATAALPPVAGRALHTRVGIATGRVVIDRIFRAPTSTEVGAFGDTPSLAARLQAVAGPDEVIVADSTLRLLGSVFLFEPLGTVHLKGFFAPVRASRLLGEAWPQTRFDAQRGPATTALFVGRERELDRLQQAWEACRDSQPSLVLVTGEPGIGKSRLCREFIERNALPAEACLILQCSAFVTASALQPWRQALIERCGIVEADDRSTRASKLDEWLSRLFTDRPFPAEAFGLGPLLGLEGAIDPVEDDGLQRVHRAILSILPPLACGGPVLVVAEDLHWADAQTEALLRLAARTRFEVPVTFLLTARPEFPSFDPPPKAAHLDLQGLTVRAARELVAHINASTLPESLVDAIVSRSDGVPLFLEEITRSMIERLRDGHSVSADGTVPLTLHDSLMSRLDRLGETRRIAQVAAVIGREFDTELLAEVLEVSRQRVTGHVNTLLEAELVERLSPARQGTYRFRHALIRQVAYDSLLRSERADMHRRVAAAMQGMSTRGVSVILEVLARHHEAAGDRRAAISAWKAAASEALSLAADAQAALCFERALELLTQQDPGCSETHEWVEVLSGSGRALLNSEGYASELARDRWNRAAELAGADLGPEELIHLIGGQCVIRFAQGRARDHEAVLVRFRDRLVDSGHRVAAASWHAQMSSCLLLTGRAEGAWTHGIQAVDALRGIDPAQLHDVGGARVDIANLSYVGRCAMYVGRLTDSESLIDTCLSLARSTEHGPAVCWSLMVDVVRHLAWERHDAALRSLDEYEPLARSLGLRIRMSNAEIQRAIMAINRGEVVLGADAARSSLERYRRCLGLFHLSEWASMVAHALLRRGEVSGAAEFIDIGVQVERDTDECFHHAELLRARALVAWHQGSADRAREMLLEAIRCASAQGMHLLALRAANDLAALTPELADRTVRETLGQCMTRIHAPADFPEMRRARERLALMGQDVPQH